jgi:uncharacterized protein with PQ loop repeat
VTGRHRITRVIVTCGVTAISGCRALAIHDTASLLVPGPQHSEVVGLVAGFGTTFASLPDLIVMLKRRSTGGIRPTMAGIMAVSQLAWVYYGLLIGSRPVIMWNVIAVAMNSLSVGAYLAFARAERRRAGRAPHP